MIIPVLYPFYFPCVIEGTIFSPLKYLFSRVCLSSTSTSFTYFVGFCLVLCLFRVFVLLRFILGLYRACFLPPFRSSIVFNEVLERFLIHTLLRKGPSFCFLHFIPPLYSVILLQFLFIPFRLILSFFPYFVLLIRIIHGLSRACFIPPSL